METLLILGQIIRLLPATPYNIIRQISTSDAFFRFNTEGPFPIAIFHFYPHRSSPETVVHSMTAGLVVGNRRLAGMFAVIVQISEQETPFFVFNNRHFALYSIHGFYNLTQTTVRRMQERASSLPLSSERGLHFDSRESLPIPQANLPQTAVYFRPQVLTEPIDLRFNHYYSSDEDEAAAGAAAEGAAGGSAAASDDSDNDSTIAPVDNGWVQSDSDDHSSVNVEDVATRLVENAIEDGSDSDEDDGSDPSESAGLT
jgi:hypothetical protein